MCVLLFQMGGNVRNVFEEGKTAAQEEEDIMGDFPPCLHWLNCTYLVWFCGVF